VGSALLDTAGMAHTSMETLQVLAFLSGGGFGPGFALAGYSPETSLAAAAEGTRDGGLPP
jgi:hypothetical protein